MKSFRTRSVFFALVVLIAGCGAKDGAYNPERYHVVGTAQPAGIVAALQGIYSQPVHGAVIPECCWIAPYATFLVPVPPHGRTLHLWVYNAALVPQPQGISVSISGIPRPFAPELLRRGFSQIELPLPKRVVDRHELSICVRSAKYFERYKGGAKYSFILQSVYVK